MPRGLDWLASPLMWTGGIWRLRQGVRVRVWVGLMVTVRKQLRRRGSGRSGCVCVWVGVCVCVCVGGGVCVCVCLRLLHSSVGLPLVAAAEFHGNGSLCSAPLLPVCCMLLTVVCMCVCVFACTDKILGPHGRHAGCCCRGRRGAAPPAATRGQH